MENTRLNSLRNNMRKQGIDLYYLNTTDYHMSEYVPEYFKTIRYFSGFTGSLATLLVGLDDANIFVDGRYHVQADSECLPNDVKVVKLGLKNALEPVDFIKKYYAGKTVGIDGKRTSAQFGKRLETLGVKVKSIDIYSELIENRTPLGNDEIYELDIQYTGLSRKKKLDMVKYCLANKIHIVSNLESIAYILNLRSNDIKYTPVFLAYLIINNDSVLLFVEKGRMNDELVDKLRDDGVRIMPYDSFYDYLDGIIGQNVTLDENKISYEIYRRLTNGKNRISSSRSIIEEMKSIKNPVEQNNAKLAHIYDGVALVRFFKWLEEQDKSQYNEYQVAMKLDEFRLSYRAFDLSFNSIVSYNENAAINHYSPSPTDSKRLDNKGILLLDTGGQYLCGTTDVTRTIALGEVSPEIKKAFTIVLKSMFNLSEMKFISGISGNQIDVIARKDLWEQGWNFMHGTGHGVGHILSVHEAPPNIRYMHTENKAEEVELKNGMIFSDEPGVYFENEWGIRCENLLLCRNDEENVFGQFLKFDTLTLVPFDTNMIDKNYLDDRTIDVLNRYHERVFNTLSPYLNEEEVVYLRRVTRPI